MCASLHRVGHFHVCSATVQECKRLDFEVGDKMCITIAFNLDEATICWITSERL